MLPDKIAAKFVEALELFEPIKGQPSIRNLAKIAEVLTQLLLQTPFDETEGKDNIVGIINSVTKLERYGDRTPGTSLAIKNQALRKLCISLYQKETTGPRLSHKNTASQ